MLLEVDGLDGEWEGNIGMLDSNDAINNVPFVIQWPNEGWNPQTFDASGLGPGDDRTDCSVAMETNHMLEEIIAPDCRIVRRLSLNAFCSKLMDHFDILFKRHQLVWPQRLSTNN